MTEPADILIADDDHMIGKMFSTMLKRVGYQVRTAADGREALEQIAQKQPDLLILDYMMPYLNGIEVLNQLALCPQTAALPVLVISAAVREMNLASEPVTKQMMVELLAKPVAMKDLLEHVAQMLNRVQSPVVMQVN